MSIKYCGKPQHIKFSVYTSVWNTRLQKNINISQKEGSVGYVFELDLKIIFELVFLCFFFETNTERTLEALNLNERLYLLRLRDRVYWYCGINKRRLFVVWNALLLLS
jgi:hypothetical protein